MRPQPVKRAIDVVVSSLLLVAACPLMVLAMASIWLQDMRSPIYAARRSGRSNTPFTMYKLRSMVVGADRTGVSSTARDDRRITPVGRFVRATKLDEVPQLWNVLKGDMSLVGPRPNVPSETACYTAAEARLLDVRPGITDFASIVFADEGDILAGASDPDLAYNQLIRPGKSRLGLFYVERAGVFTDLQLIFLTGVAIFSKSRARSGVARLLARLGAPGDLIALARRETPLTPQPPPGAVEVVTMPTGSQGSTASSGASS
ncbi:MAG: hypothetical protein RLZ98_212 [Pseudomonadota bacterium]|jgi:lipopolysaccharide/colanic/teichoic acid biosynthesis glycosyltransferase